MAINALEDLHNLQEKAAGDLTNLMAKFALALLNGDGLEEEEKLAAAIADAQSQADLLGRRRLLLELRSQGVKFAQEDTGGILDEVNLTVASILDRAPILARGWKRAAEVYNLGGFALAKSARVALTASIQRVIAKAVDQGASRDVAVFEIAEQLGARDVDGAARRAIFAYSDTAFRTVTTTAYTQGRISLADDPDIRRNLVGWRFDATNDSDVRHNHWAADGFMAVLDDPVWSQLRPPLGYNCRCALGVVTRRQGVKAGLIDRKGNVLIQRKAVPAGAGADPGFTPG